MVSEEMGVQGRPVLSLLYNVRNVYTERELIISVGRRWKIRLSFFSFCSELIQIYARNYSGSYCMYNETLLEIAKLDKIFRAVMLYLHCRFAANVSSGVAENLTEI